MNNYSSQALRLDDIDRLTKFKDLFLNDPNMIYLDGNSLGKLPVKSIELVNNIVTAQWGNRLIRGWNEHWLTVSDTISAKIAKLVGAHSDEIFIGDSTSLNLYKLMYAALELHPERTKIVSDDMNFPTDLYVVEGLIDKHFKQHSLSIVRSNNEIDMEESTLENELDENTAVLTLSHVTYKSAFKYNMKSVNELAAQKGVSVIWDLSHSVGSVPIELNASKATMAVGCTYKYLNAGPGASAFLYVSRALQSKLKNPIWSWFGHANPFDFNSSYKPHNSIQKFAVGTPSILAMAPIESGLDIVLEAGIENIREKSIVQSTFLITMIQQELVPIGFKIASPLDANDRGSHISLQHKEGYRINRAMIAPIDNHKVIIPDFRPPNNIRLGIAPLYITFTDLLETVTRIKSIVLEKEYLNFSEDKLTVT